MIFIGKKVPFALLYHFHDPFVDYSSKVLSSNLTTNVSFAVFNQYQFTSLLLYFSNVVFLHCILLALVKASILYLSAFEIKLYFYVAHIIIPLFFAIIILIHFLYHNFASNFLFFAGLF